jgi:hypothetical protein
MKYLKPLIAILFIMITFTACQEPENSNVDQQDMMLTYEGYSKTRHQITSSRMVRIRKTDDLSHRGIEKWNNALRFNWVIERGNGDSETVRFTDLKITNINTKEVIRLPDSEPIELKKRSDPDQENPAGLLEASWTIDAADLTANNLDFTADYQITAKIIEEDNQGKNTEFEFTSYLKQESKTMPEQTTGLTGSSYDINWTIGASFLYLEEASDLVKIEDSFYSNELGRIITLKYFGTLNSENGKLIFEEDPSKREVFYYETLESKFERVNGRLKRIANNKKHSLNKEEYGYERFYDF